MDIDVNEPYAPAQTVLSSIRNRSSYQRVTSTIFMRMQRSMRWILRSKIHQATVTDASVQYVGSIAIDSDLIEKSGLMPGEKVLVVSNTTGARLETYVITAPAHSGIITINGAAAHLIHKGEEIIIIGFELTDHEIPALKILVDKNNRFVRYLT